MPITDWPIEDRPREKLIARGARALTDAELLAIFLISGSRGISALDMAKNLLGQFSSLKDLCQASPSVMLKTRGLGKAKYAALAAAFELGQRCQQIKVQVGDALNSSRKTQMFLASRLQDYPSEVFACLFLDSRFRLIQFEELFQGTIHSASIYPREIVRRGIAHNAAKIILAHNHPSGNPTPSEADREITKVIKQTLAVVDIEVVDHIIIGNPGHYSFAEKGLLV